MDEESRHESPNNVICSGQPILFNEHDTVFLYSGKTFRSWEECEQFLNEWAKSQGFHIIKDRVTRCLSIRWYNINKDGSQEPFLVADKFIQDDQQHFSYDFNDSSTEEEESNPSDSDELELQQEIITGDKENFDPSIPKLQNPKIRRGKG
ncbi:hypothetical protein RhiirA1_464341 [Rhizophagus irregularis]|uniref:Uncharacterized protein n=1 Tax=Rhizophagus irregularis TaxID=588596 RepID=A0A2N0RI85_9GLOM|nr:hypothetical protein RhiirA1_469836 [Rhizophagus irregularis]PKC59175.1 hypothetical protein RhiirA1_469837 [Rhizophagus irregularis]PKC63016.1 hypothetical protein RhiirA1_464340 [Rhizophagus irregularis]PKC63017.1 hypothetical protein RhiirA1_464341 [Rhizophagus irregularis]